MSTFTQAPGFSYATPSFLQGQPEQPTQQVMNFFNQQRAQPPANHPYVLGTVNGIPVPKTPGNSIYIVFNENPMGKADLNKLYWKILGDGTRAYKDRIKQLGAIWIANEKYWGLATTVDPMDHRFMSLVAIANEANYASASRAQQHGMYEGNYAAAPRSQYAPQALPPMQQAPVTAYQPAWATQTQTAIPLQPLPQAQSVLPPLPVAIPQQPSLLPALPLPQPAPTVLSASQQLSHGKVTPSSSNEVFVTFRVRIPSVGDRLKVYDTSSSTSNSFVFVIDSVYDSPNGAYKDTFTAKIVEPADKASTDSHLFKIVNGDWTLITTASTVKNTFKTEFL